MPTTTCFPRTPATPTVLSVWELTAQIKDLLEAAFPAVWVAGEISNFARPQSGHCYLTLKDDRAQLAGRDLAERGRPRCGSTCTTAWR